MIPYLKRLISGVIMVNTNKKYAILCLLFVLTFSLVFATITYIYDPFFHYHKPYSWVSYNLNYQRYQNDGILKHFDYDAIIIGSSMIENSKSSELDEIFNVHSVKIPLSGASNKEINNHIETAIKYNDNIKLIIRGLDMHRMDASAENMRYDYDYYPWYLYDELLYNDVKYVLNKSILFKYIIPTIRKTNLHQLSTTFDDYSKWYNIRTFSKEELLKNYDRLKQAHEKVDITDVDIKNINENTTQNVLDIAKSNPQIDFYVFVPPFSIYFWDSLNQEGTLEKMLDTIDIVFNLLVGQDNIHLYSFNAEKDIILNADIYKDIYHYNEKVNSLMLNWIKNGYDEINKDNIDKYLKDIRDFFTNYQYDILFE